AGLYKHIVVAGADVVSEFIVSGFQSFQSLSPKPCRPYDADRDGLTLGEGAGTMVLSTFPGKNGPTIRYLGGATSNDANHISGPSRTGDGLFFAIRHAMQVTGGKTGIDYINAHGTATPFNDEMESKALTLAGLSNVPMNSLKGYWAHTLGAAGVIETIAGIHSLKHQTLIKTLGFSEPGLPHPLNIIQETRSANLQTFIKIASGFGGCNAAAIFSTS
ncbi:MAG: hypothetical protein FJY10_12520, partial [Bacteroidetes bacterium]|nr:hypothetical protein [Bacteroidota bacterium]